ncbi:cytochrome P450 family protein [Actinophytocola glycyrrhizae]|uniref:Cytochrome P450 n=1 Tax=Actinophytocola glycyrrhizae TaxID=2044873 RepID=A0ABV9S678_9PSEU
MTKVEETTRGGTTVVMVNGHDAARQALSKRSITKDLDASSMGLTQDLYDATIRHMLFLDPPDHTRLRRLISAAFTSQRIEMLRPRVTQIAHELLDAIEGHETVDLIPTFAWPLPFQVICDLLGVPSGSRDEFRAWTNIVADPARQPERAVQLTRLLAVIRELVAEQRAQPGDGLLSELIAVRDGEERLSENELTSMVFMLMVAGTETTINLIGNGVFRLLEDRSRWDQVRADPQLLTTAIEEFVRYDSPAAVTTSRTATETFDLVGHTVEAGTPVVISLARANRDQDQFPYADQLQLDRRQNPHLGFGHGIHYCLGAPLARLEAEVAYTVLMTRFPELDLAVSASELTWRDDFMRCLHRLPVRTRAEFGASVASSSRD